MKMPTMKCPSCSGSGFLTDGEALERQTCTTDEDCRRCDGTGRILYRAKAADLDDELRHHDK